MIAKNKIYIFENDLSEVLHLTYNNLKSSTKRYIIKQYQNGYLGYIIKYKTKYKLYLSGIETSCEKFIDCKYQILKIRNFIINIETKLDDIIFVSNQNLLPIITIQNYLYHENILGQKFYNYNRNDFVFTFVKNDNQYYIFSGILDNFLNYSRNINLEIFKHPNCIINYHNKFKCPKIIINTHYEEYVVKEFKINNPWRIVSNQNTEYFYRNCKIIKGVLPNEIKKKCGK